MKQARFSVSLQADGRKFVTYEFVSDADEAFSETSLQAADFDPAATLAAQAARWDAMLAASEIAANLEAVATKSGAPFRFKYSSIAQARAALREAFKSETGRRLHVIAAWLNDNLTNAQLQTLFSINAAQATALRTKLQNAATRLAAFESEAGQ